MKKKGKEMIAMPGVSKDMNGREENGYETEYERTASKVMEGRKKGIDTGDTEKA